MLSGRRCVVWPPDPLLAAALALRTQPAPASATVTCFAMLCTVSAAAGTGTAQIWCIWTRSLPKLQSFGSCCAFSHIVVPLCQQPDPQHGPQRCQACCADLLQSVGQAAGPCGKRLGGVDGQAGARPAGRQTGRQGACGALQACSWCVKSPIMDMCMVHDIFNGATSPCQPYIMSS